MTEPQCHHGVTEKNPIEKWADADSYNLAAFDQTEGAWQIDHPLPLPAWSKTVKEPMIIEKVNSSRVSKNIILIIF